MRLSLTKVTAGRQLEREWEMSGVQPTTVLRSKPEALPAESSSETALHAGLHKFGRRDEAAKGLLLVGIYKMSKVVFFSALGFGALHLIHRDLGDEVLRLTEMLRLGPESHVVGFLMGKADTIGHHQLRQASMFSFGYAGLCLIEGTGLLLRKVWAEYFTVLLTLMGLPLESYELWQRFNWLKVGALVLNLIVLFYLVAVVKRKREADARV
jgi:uncharacterized membrane protein (DUF2068 family)